MTQAAKSALLGFLRSGKVKTTNDLQKQRIQVCLECEKLSEDFRCHVCGCFVKKKAALMTQDCPLKKWPHK